MASIIINNQQYNDIIVTDKDGGVLAIISGDGSVIELDGVKVIFED